MVVLLSLIVSATAMVLSFQTIKISNALSRGEWQGNERELECAGRKIWISIVCAIAAAVLNVLSFEGFVSLVWVVFVLFQYHNLRLVDQRRGS